MNSIDFTLNGHRYTNDPNIVASAGIPPEYQFIGYNAIQALANYAIDVVQVGGGSTEDAGASAAVAELAANAAQQSAQAAHDAAERTQLVGTSTTLLVVAKGIKSLVTQAGRQWAKNTPIFAVSASDPKKYISGTVDSYAGGALAINVTSAGMIGSEVSDWVISTSGAQGAPGQTASNTQFNVIPVAAETLDLTQGNFFSKTVTGNITFAFSAPPVDPETGIPAKGFSFSLQIVHTAGIVSLPTTVKASRNLIPAMESGKTHLLMFVTTNGGATWRISVLPNYDN